MTKLTNYLATVTDVNSVFATTGPAVPNSERCVVKDETGQTAGSVGALNHWQIDPTADPLVTYTNNRLPRWQDLVPLTKYTYVRYDTSGCSSFNPVEVYSYVYYPNGYYYLDGGTTLYYLSNYSHTNYTIYFASASSGSCIPLLNCSIIDILSTNALDSYYAFRLYQSTVGVASYNNYIIISPNNTERHILSNQTSATTSYMIAGFATSVSESGFTNFFRYGINIYKLKQDYPAITTFTFDLYGARLYETLQQFTVKNSIKTGFLIDLTPPANGVDFQPSIAEDNASTFITTMCQPLNTYVKIGYFTLDTTANTFIYTNIQGSSCTTTTTSTTSTTTTCNPTPNWVNTGTSCYGSCNLYYVQTDQNTCAGDPTSGQTQQGALIESNSTSCGGCCGQSTAEDWQNNGSYSCYGGCDQYYVQSQINPCAPGYPQQPRQGGLRAANSTECGGCCGQGPCCGQSTSQHQGSQVGTYHYCSNGNTFGDPVYINDNVCYTGGDIYLLNGNWTSNNPSNGSPNTAPIWQNTGDPYCSGCTLYQNQVDINTCSSSYGDPRDPPVDLGLNTTCGTWTTELYCVNYGVAPYTQRSREVNSCVPGAYQNDQFVTDNSPSCGYVPPPTCRTYQIVGYNADEYVDGTYTNCGGGSDSFSFYGGPGTVGSVCAQPSSVYITTGNGAANDVGSC